MRDEKRLEERDICEIEASIQYGQGAVAPCLVTDLSEHGARLRIDPGAELPPCFKLRLPVLGDIADHRLVELRWRHGTAAGVQFLL